jgi:DNA mismatch endonuclease (patch repair protein)
MADKICKEKRSWNMSQIRSKDTKPELKVRSLLHKSGYRFRIHVNILPGKPDIVLSKYHKVIFINGCFWHRHANCVEASVPKTNSNYWEEKIRRNIIRDNEQTSLLIGLGWDVVIIWECELKGSDEKITNFLTNRIFQS